MKKNFYLIIDTETTMQNHVFDFGAIVFDTKGNIHREMGVIIKDFANEPLFHDEKSTLWNLERRQNQYANMLESGQRMYASVQAVNRWLDKVLAEYPDIMLLAYNLPFDLDKCDKSGIDLSRFVNKQCLWALANGIYADTKKYRQFCLENHYFNSRTEYGNMTYQTNAEVMTHYVTGINLDEPHTALEDCKGWEMPIMLDILKKKDWKNRAKSYNWRDRQLRDAFIAK